MDFVPLNNPATVNKMIAELLKSSAKFSEKLHLVSLNLLHTIDTTGDIRPLQRLYDGLTKANRDAVSRYFVDFGKVSFDIASATFKYRSKATTQMLNAQEVSPLEHFHPKKAPVPAVFDFVKLVDGLMAKAAKHNISADAIKALATAKDKALAA